MANFTTTYYTQRQLLSASCLEAIAFGTRLEQHLPLIEAYRDDIGYFTYEELVYLLLDPVKDLDEYDDIIDFCYLQNITWLLEEMGLGIPCTNPDHQFAKVFEAQAAEGASFNTEDNSEAANTSDIGITHLTDGTPGSLLSLMPTSKDGTRGLADMSDINALESFLSRPQIIFTKLWAINTVEYNVFSIYEQLLNGPLSLPLREKLTRYFLFKADGVRIQVKINGSPFHYGRMYLAWNPSNRQNYFPETITPANFAVVSNNGMGSLSAGDVATLLTQRPGCFIDPSTNQPQQLDLPFIFPYDYCDLRLTDHLFRLGRLELFTLSQLRHANDSTEGVNVQIIASLINPVVSIPNTKTVWSGEAWEAQAMSMRKDSGKSKNNRGTTGVKKKKSAAKQVSVNTSGGDEYGGGVISAPATALANFAGTLSHVPVIGKYAVATKMAVSAVSDIAKLFGFSKPVNLDMHQPTRLFTYGKMSNTSGDDTIPKLTLDPKQELNVDPTTIGAPDEDHMALAHIFRRNSLIFTCQWEIVHAAGTLLGSFMVHPCNYPWNTNGTRTTHFPSALGWASLPFKYWSGDLEYTFKFVCSQMHRGRARISWTPTTDNAAAFPTLQMYESFNHVVDLSEERDVTLCVNWAQPCPFLPTKLQTGAGLLGSQGVPLVITPNSRVCNGKISISVFTELGAPTTEADIEILVFVRAGNSYRVRCPDTTQLNGLSHGEAYSTTIWSGEAWEAQAASADQLVDEENVWAPSNVLCLNGTSCGSNIADGYDSTFFGEQITSVRALCKRYQWAYAKHITAANATDWGYVVMRQSDIPPSPGIPLGLSFVQDTFGASLPYNFTTFGFTTWYMKGYLGYRGGFRWKCCLMGDINCNPGNMLVRRDNTYRSGATVNGVNDINSTQILINDIYNIAGKWNREFKILSASVQGSTPYFEPTAGGEISYNFIQGGIEYEVPYQNPLRFLYINEIPVGILQNQSAIPFSLFNAFKYGQTQNHEIHTYARGINKARVGWHMYSAAAEDFSLFYFLNAPLLYTFEDPGA